MDESETIQPITSNNHSNDKEKRSFIETQESVQKDPGKKKGNHYHKQYIKYICKLFMTL